MNGEDLLKAMGQVDEQYIQEAETACLEKPKYLWLRRTAAAAACLAVVLGVGLTMGDKFLQDVSVENTPGGIDRAPEMNVPILMEQETVACTEGRGFPNDLPDEANTEPAFAPETAAPDQAPSEQEPSEVPSVVVKIEAWTEYGFEATVEKIVDTDIYPVGTKLQVIFRENIRIVETDGDVIRGTLRTPTQEDFPQGSRVQILFSVGEDGVILVEQIGKEEAF